MLQRIHHHPILHLLEQGQQEQEQAVALELVQELVLAQVQELEEVLVLVVLVVVGHLDLQVVQEVDLEVEVGLLVPRILPLHPLPLLLLLLHLEFLPPLVDLVLQVLPFLLQLVAHHPLPSPFPLHPK